MRGAVLLGQHGDNGRRHVPRMDRRNGREGRNRPSTGLQEPGTALVPRAVASTAGPRQIRSEPVLVVP